MRRGLRLALNAGGPPLSAFRPKAFYKVGRMSWCAECVDAYMRERYAADPEYRERIKRERRERYKREGR